MASGSVAAAAPPCGDAGRHRLWEGEEFGAPGSSFSMALAALWILTVPGIPSVKGWVAGLETQWGGAWWAEGRPAAELEEEVGPELLLPLLFASCLPEGSKPPLSHSPATASCATTAQSNGSK